MQSEAGSAIGAIVSTPPAVIERRQPPEQSPNRVVRKATAEDVMVRLKRQQREQEAHRVALLKIRERGLEMKLTRVEQLFDGSRLIFYFTAEGRVDFRELVRELAAEFHTASRCVRSARATKRRCWVDTGRAGGRCAARRGSTPSSRSRSRWQSSRTSA